MYLLIGTCILFLFIIFANTGFFTFTVAIISSKFGYCKKDRDHRFVLKFRSVLLSNWFAYLAPESCFEKVRPTVLISEEAELCSNLDKEKNAVWTSSAFSKSNPCSLQFGSASSRDWKHSRQQRCQEMAEQTFLRSAINEVLPELAEASKYILEETLQSIGVETYDDFQFIVEKDLLSALRPIQARKALAAWKLRCRTPETSRSSSNASPDTPPSQQSSSPLSVSSNSSSSNQTSAADWVDTFEIPWKSSQKN
ncbi:uncharacterized protein LOC129370957 [Poeciliopsis prolifica]|uniref:uncharacterized protein LOC129370957 n=1 Tax=Poeciliopsis prolifica TaxID=188132 RepID=UPI0024133584|nr:uncharacterized protein LOC129370957 [Poeciliopsis prolifica]